MVKYLYVYLAGVTLQAEIIRLTQIVAAISVAFMAFDSVGITTATQLAGHLEWATLLHNGN